MDRLSGQIAIVTGGGSGIGEAIAERLQSEGAHVVITDIQEQAGASVASRLDSIFLAHDVSLEQDWETLFRTIEQALGPPTILVNNAGIIGPMERPDPEHASYDDWKRVMTVNADSVFLGCRAAIRAMRKSGGGSIVNMSSVTALLATPYATAYGASKAVVRHLTASVAQHCAQHRLNIRCNSVHPGIVKTPLWLENADRSAEKRNVSQAEIISEAATTIPIGELAQPGDIAAMVAFLVSNEARHITGEQFIVDGGLMSCNTFKAPGRTRS